LKREGGMKETANGDHGGKLSNSPKGDVSRRGAKLGKSRAQIPTFERKMTREKTPLRGKERRIQGKKKKTL